MTKLKKNQIVTKLKHSNCDKTQKLKLWQNSITKIVTKQKKSNSNPNCDKTPHSDCDKSKNTNCDKNQKNQIGTKLKNSSCEKNQ